MTLNPDPAVPYRLITEEKLEQIERDAWNEGHAAGRSVMGLIVAAICGAIVGAMLVLALGATPRAAASPVVASTPPLDSGVAQRQSAEPRSRASEVAGSNPAPGVTGGTPQPTGELGTAIATGTASWYDDGPGLYAAMTGWRFGQKPYPVRVCRGATCVIVTVRDCLCGRSDRLIDLSPEAFSRLANLSVGILRVTVEWLDDPSITPPPTTTDPVR